MTRKRKIIVATAVAALAAGGASFTVASGSGGDNEAPITGPALARASAAALEFTGGGEVTDTEVGDEESFYEVEVTLDDGTQIDVQLDESFAVVGSEADDPNEDEGDDTDD